jgi:hypothetical protein
VVLTNDGEDAHQAGFTAYFRSFIKLSDFSIKYLSGKKSDSPLKCFEEITVKFNKITCSVGNPFQTGAKAKVELDLDIIYVRENVSPSFDLKIEVWSHKTKNKRQNELSRSSRGPSNWGYGGSEHATVHTFGDLKFEADVELVTATRPEFIPVKYSPSQTRRDREVSDTKTGTYGDKIESVLVVKNRGATPANDLVVSVKIPMKLKTGEFLLYPMDSVVIKDIDLKSRCHLADGFNPQKFDYVDTKKELIPQRSKRSVLDFVEDETHRMVKLQSHTLNCDSELIECAEVVCNIESLNANDNAWIRIQTAISHQALQRQFEGSNIFDIEWNAEINSKNSMLKGDLASKNAFRVDQEVLVQAYGPSMEWWLIALIVAAIFISFFTMLIILWKCGFFARRKLPVHRRFE